MSMGESEVGLSKASKTTATTNPNLGRTETESLLFLHLLVPRQPLLESIASPEHPALGLRLVGHVIFLAICKSRCYGSAEAPVMGLEAVHTASPPRLGSPGSIIPVVAAPLGGLSEWGEEFCCGWRGVFLGPA